jgi:RNA polymerase sigma-70 factor (ECF subfamily)
MSSWPDDDKELVGKAQAGNVEAFGCLYERHAPAIFRYLFAHLPDRLDAEDLTGEVFLKTWQALPRYRERGMPFRAFLFRVAHNALVDHNRRAFHTARGIPLELDELLSDNSPGPVEMAHSHFDHQELLKVMSRLHKDYQTVLGLRFFAELTPEETAMVMQRSPGSIRVLQHRALAALRKRLENEQEILI